MRFNIAELRSLIDLLTDADHGTSTNCICHNAGTLTFVIGRQHLLRSGLGCHTCISLESIAESLLIHRFMPRLLDSLFKNSEEVISFDVLLALEVIVAHEEEIHLSF